MSSSSSAARPNLAACGSSCQEGCSCLGVRSVVACWARLLLPRQLSALLLLHPVRSLQLLHHARPLLLLHRLRPLLLLHRLRPLLLLHRRRPCRLHVLGLPCIDVRGQSKSTPTCMPGHACSTRSGQDSDAASDAGSLSASAEAKLRRMCNPKQVSGRVEAPEDMRKMWDDITNGRKKLIQMMVDSENNKANPVHVSCVTL